MNVNIIILFLKSEIDKGMWKDQVLFVDGIGTSHNKCLELSDQHNKTHELFSASHLIEVNPEFEALYYKNYKMVYKIQVGNRKKYSDKYPLLEIIKKQRQLLLFLNHKVINKNYIKLIKIDIKQISLKKIQKWLIEQLICAGAD